MSKVKAGIVVLLVVLMFGFMIFAAIRPGNDPDSIRIRDSYESDRVRTPTIITLAITMLASFGGAAALWVGFQRARQRILENYPQMAFDSNGMLFLLAIPAGIGLLIGIALIAILALPSHSGFHSIALVGSILAALYALTVVRVNLKELGAMPVNLTITPDKSEDDL